MVLQAKQAISSGLSFSKLFASEGLNHDCKSSYHFSEAIELFSNPSERSLTEREVKFISRHTLDFEVSFLSYDVNESQGFLIVVVCGSACIFFLLCRHKAKSACSQESLALRVEDGFGGLSLIDLNLITRHPSHRNSQSCP